MAQSSASTVNEDDDLIRFETERLRYVLVVDVGHTLDFEEVVPRAQTPDLVLAAVFGFVGDSVGVGVRSAALVLAVKAVGFGSVAFFDSPIEAAFEDLFDGLDVGFDDASAAEAGGDVLEEGVDVFLLLPLEVLVGEVRPEHPDAA